MTNNLFKECKFYVYSNAFVFSMMSIESKNGNWLLIPTLDHFKLNEGDFFELTNFDGMKSMNLDLLLVSSRGARQILESQKPPNSGNKN